MVSNRRKISLYSWVFKYTKLV